MEDKILFVDDEPNILEAYQRWLRKDFQMTTASSGEEGLQALASGGPFAVVISDMRMPGMDGIQFLARVKERAPECVRIMLTGNGDQQTAIDAINEGSIFRFLNKPCLPETLTMALKSGIEQHRLLTVEKDLLKRTLMGSIKMLTEILALTNPTAFSRTQRVRRIVDRIVNSCKFENQWQIELAAMLSQVGCVTVPENTLTKVYEGDPLTPDELRMMHDYPQTGHDLVVRIPRLELVAEIIAMQEKAYNGSGPPFSDKRMGEEIPLGARIMKVALDLDKLLETGSSEEKALEELHERRGHYDQQILRTLGKIPAIEGDYNVRLVKISELTNDMILAEDITPMKGLTLVTKGQEVTDSLKIRLKNFATAGVLTEPIKVMMPNADVGCQMLDVRSDVLLLTSNI